MPEIEWRKLRADQLRDLSKQDAIVILPVASLEQHGPHLPVEVDSMLGETVASRTAAKVPPAARLSWCCRCCGPDCRNIT